MARPLAYRGGAAAAGAPHLRLVVDRGPAPDLDALTAGCVAEGGRPPGRFWWLVALTLACLIAWQSTRAEGADMLRPSPRGAGQTTRSASPIPGPVRAGARAANAVRARAAGGRRE